VNLATTHIPEWLEEETEHSSKEAEAEEEHSALQPEEEDAAAVPCPEVPHDQFVWPLTPKVRTVTVEEALLPGDGREVLVACDCHEITGRGRPCRHIFKALEAVGVVDFSPSGCIRPGCIAPTS
jgi:hypothetical protein